MIYLEQSVDAQVVRIPRNILENSGEAYTLTLENTIDRSRVSVTPDEVSAGALYYVVTVTLPDVLPAGEYSYELRQGAAVLAVGVLTIGEYEYDTTQYESAAIYTQYE